MTEGAVDVDMALYELEKQESCYHLTLMMV